MKSLLYKIMFENLCPPLYLLDMVLYVDSLAKFENLCPPLQGFICLRL